MEYIIYEAKEGVAQITLNRPDALNALNPAMMVELRSVLLDIQADDVIKVLIVQGAGRAFSAGVDIKATNSQGFQKGGSFMDVGKEVGDLILNLPKVTIAKVHGYCFTGALEMMLFFDMAFCTEDTQFGDTHAKWSVMPRWGMSQRLARRVGLAKAKELTFRAMRVKGPEAERIGLVNRAFKAEEFDSEINRIVADIQENSFAAIKAIKRLYNEGYNTTLREGLLLELAADTYLPDTDVQLAKFQKK